MILFARNACFDIAKKLGVKYFIQLDDDYQDFRYTSNNNYEYITSRNRIKNLDKIFQIMLAFYAGCELISTLCIIQGGDLIGGKNSTPINKLKQGKLMRKAMNSFICSIDRPFSFMGRINEDVNTYVKLGNLGKLFLTYPRIALDQTTTQSNSGGMTETYLDSGTYIKTFYSVMYNPSCVKITTMGMASRRIHHRILWRYAVPEIISEKYRVR